MRQACLIGMAPASLVLMPIRGWAHGPSQPAHQPCRIGDFTLESGEVASFLDLVTPRGAKPRWPAWPRPGFSGAAGARVWAEPSR